MKLVLRIFNIVIMVICLVAGVFLFTTPTISFNSNIAVNVSQLSGFVPTSETYGADINIPELLGTDTIHVGLSFKVNLGDATKFLKKDKETVNQKLIGPGMDSVVQTLHEPLDLIVDYTVRGVMKSIIKQTITGFVEEAKNQYGASDYSTQDIMDEVGMTDTYFTNFSNALYDASNIDGTTIGAVSEVLYDQIDEALAMAEDSGVVDTSSFGADRKDEIKATLYNGYKEIKLVREDQTLKPIGDIAYIYLTDFIVADLAHDVAPQILEQKVGESFSDYSDRMLKEFVFARLPAITYDIISYVVLGLFIGLFAFAAIWLVLFVLTLIKTFSKEKPWTIFGFWFWLIGPLQIVLGLAITIAGKFILPRFDMAMTGLPISKIIIALRTYALVPSILFIAMIPLGIAYAVIKGIAKKSA